MKETKYKVTMANEEGEVVHTATVLILSTEATWGEWEERLMDADLDVDIILMPEMEWRNELGSIGEELAESMVADYNQKAEKEGDNG
jgi:hypothetical protein